MQKHSGFTVGDIVRVIKNDIMAARIGALALVKGFKTLRGETFILLEWDRNTDFCGQMDGVYDLDCFEVVDPNQRTIADIVMAFDLATLVEKDEQDWKDLGHNDGQNVAGWLRKQAVTALRQAI